MVGHNARFLHEPCMVLGGARPCADVSLKNPFKSVPKLFFPLWRRDRVLELQFLLPLSVVATQCLQIAVERLHKGFSLLRLRA